MKKPAAPPAMNSPAAPVFCPKCQGEELVVLATAGRIVHGVQGVQFVPARMRVACAHCLTTYNVRVDGRVQPQLLNAGAMAGAPGLLSNDAADGEPPTRPGPLEGSAPTDPADLVKMLAETPGLRMG